MKSTWIMVLTLLTASNAVAEDDCLLPVGFISENARPLPSESFASISKEMITSEIIKRLGPAVRDVGSGLYVLEWKTTDGRVFHVSTAGICSKPMALGFYNPEISKKPLQRTRSEQRASER